MGYDNVTTALVVISALGLVKKGAENYIDPWQRQNIGVTESHPLWNCLHYIIRYKDIM